MKPLTIITAAVLIGTAAQAKIERVYIGSNKSKGIYFTDLDTKTGKLTEPKLATETSGCGFIAIHPNKKWLYSTGASAFKFIEDGTLIHLNTQTTEGGGACHVSLDRAGKCLMVAYYGGGAVASFKILEDGSLSEAKSFHKHEGSGEHPKRQKKAYAHSIYTNPDNTYAYAADLGIDKIMIYKLNSDEATLTPAGEVVVPGGAMGPRHMKWNTKGSLLYVLNELDLSISVFKATDDGQLEFLMTSSTLPEGYDKSEMTCAEIRVHPNGKYIYASNRDLIERGRDSISIFTRHESGLKRLDTVPAEVWVPRNFNIDSTGRWMLVGGQKSRDIAVFNVGPKTGRMKFSGHTVQFDGSPICFEFLD